MKKNSIYKIKLSQNGKTVKLPKWAKYVELPPNAPEGFNVHIDSSSCTESISVLQPESSQILYLGE